MQIEVWLFILIVLLGPALGAGVMWGLVKRFSTRSMAKATQEAERVVAAAKAQAEMAPGTWLVSLEFAVPGVLPHAQLRAPGGRVVWIYRLPLRGQSK